MAADTRPLEEILDPRFQRSMNIAQRMHLGMTLADYLQKEKKEGMKYTIVSHDKVTAEIRGVCQRIGVIYYPVEETAKFSVDGNRAQLQLAVRFQNIDNLDDYIDVLGIGFGIDPGDKGPGKAISYAVKYALLKAFGLETGDDPDQDQEVKHRSNTAQRADDLLKALITTTDPAVFLETMRVPSTQAILSSLMEQDPAEARRTRTEISKHAKAIGADMSTLVSPSA